MNNATSTIVLVDDHQLFRKGIIELIDGFSKFQVLWEAENGKDFTQKIQSGQVPDIVILDITMPVMDGYETAQWINKTFPQIKMLALSMHNDEETIFKMLQVGIDGYILKNSEPAELNMALNSLASGESYYSNRVTATLMNKMKSKTKPVVELTLRETEFLKLVCSELPYKAFGPILGIHGRVVEATRETLFRKLEVTTRVGLVIYAIKNKIYVI